MSMEGTGGGGGSITISNGGGGSDQTAAVGGEGKKRKSRFGVFAVCCCCDDDTASIDGTKEHEVVIPKPRGCTDCAYLIVYIMFCCIMVRKLKCNFPEEVK